jgi:hypothetical protein
MNKDVHEKVRGLIDAAMIEGVSRAEGVWLEEHLETCPACAEYQAATTGAIQALQSVTIEMDPALVNRTKARLRERIGRPQKGGEEPWLLRVSVGVAAAMTMFSAGVFWEIANWLLPGPGSSLLWIGLLLFWLSPSLAAAALLLSRSLNGSARPEMRAEI